MKIKTPCVGLCSTTWGDDVCIGCLRTVKEVVSWNGMTETQKAEVLQKIKLRQLDKSRSDANIK